MESRTADALYDLVEAVREDFDNAAPDERVEAMLASADSVLDEADEPGQDNMSTTGDRMRQLMAQLVQYINTERPQMAGMVEVDRALDVLSNPEGNSVPQTSSVASSQVGRATPYAEEQQETAPEESYAEMKRDEAKSQGKFVPETARTPDEKRQESLDTMHVQEEQHRQMREMKDQEKK